MLRRVRCGAILVILASGCSFQISADVGRDAATGSDARLDAAGGIDASVIGDGPTIIDAPIDAAPIPCTTTGLVCPGGTTPHLIPCAFPGECWVGCRDGSSVDYAAAKGLCATWGGELGWITNPLEETCLRQTIDGAIALGLEQAPNSGLPGLGWTWNGTMLAFYINWSVGQPNDGDAIENNTEQCAYSASSGSWQDVPCSSTHSRFSCRR